MFRHRRFFWVPKPHVATMLFNPGGDGRPVCPMYTRPHSQGILYTPGVLSPRSSFRGRRKLEIFLGGKPTLLTLCLASILLRQPYVVWTSGRRATEVGLSLGLEVLTLGLRARCICWRLYPFWYFSVSNLLILNLLLVYLYPIYLSHTCFSSCLISFHSQYPYHLYVVSIHPSLTLVLPYWLSSHQLIATPPYFPEFATKRLSVIAR
jgi:hypothetical protein